MRHHSFCPSIEKISSNAKLVAILNTALSNNKLATEDSLPLGRKDASKFTVVKTARGPEAEQLKRTSDDEALVVAESSSEDLEPEQKRSRIASSSTAGPSGIDLESLKSAADPSTSQRNPGAWVAPFSLLKVQGIPAYGNR